MFTITSQLQKTLAVVLTPIITAYSYYLFKDYKELKFNPWSLFMIGWNTSFLKLIDKFIVVLWYS